MDFEKIIIICLTIVALGGFLLGYGCTMEESKLREACIRQGHTVIVHGDRHNCLANGHRVTP
jgi:hypothetical protein